MGNQSDKTRTVCQPAGNYYDKYDTKNPIASKLMAGFLGQFMRFVEMSGAKNVYEVGCGEGEGRFKIVELASPLPWTMILTKRC